MFQIHNSEKGESEKQAVGTIEIFGGKAGVLRIDLAKEYENQKKYS